MKGKPPERSQGKLFYQNLNELVNPKHRFYKLANQIPWDEFESYFSDLYSDAGRPAKPIRLMVSLLILKQLENLSDEVVVERWVENPYYQFLSGEEFFQWEFPCHPTDLVYFRKRIGEDGAKKILQVSIDLHGKKAKEPEVLVDTTVQEKNITFPTDTKLYRRIIVHCVKIAKEEQVVLRQSYKRTAKQLMLAQRFRHHPKNRKKARAAQRRLKTIAGRLVRELERKLEPRTFARHAPAFEIYKRILSQTKKSKNKIYSIHEPLVYCISKGKEHKRYEFGAKASIIMTKNSGVIIGAVSFPENIYDGHTLPEVLKQSEELVGRRAKVAICDRGYRGKSNVGGTKIEIPKNPKKRASTYEKRKARKRFRRRAGIEPVIGHLKSDYRLFRNYLKGSEGDSINLMLSAAAFNFKKLMKQLLNNFFQIFVALNIFAKPVEFENTVAYA